MKIVAFIIEAVAFGLLVWSAFLIADWLGFAVLGLILLCVAVMLARSDTPGTGRGDDQIG